MFEPIEVTIAKCKRDICRWSKELAVIDLDRDPDIADQIITWIIRHSKLIGSMESLVGAAASG